MIPARRGAAVLFAHERAGKKTYTTVPITAWNDDAEPLIAGRHGLIHPDHHDGACVGWEVVSAGEHWTAFPAPPGWKVDVTYTDDEPTYTYDVIAFEHDCDDDGMSAVIAVAPEDAGGPVIRLPGRECKTWRLHRDPTP
ncbi:MAG: hypothetical protein IPM45_15620 [Acidimicrobiales bacterium]|nr:hypothetical protein [Acidimicrobiales bacterium]